MVNEKPKVEINKVEKARLQENKAEEPVVMKAKANSDVGVLRINELAIRRINLLNEGILGEEGILGLGE